MGIFQAFRLAFKSMVGNKLRTILTMLGVIIGVATFITIVSFGEGAKKNITDSIESMGTNLIDIRIIGRNSNRNITYEDFQEFARQNDSDIEAIAPMVSGRVTTKFSNKSWETMVEGTSPEYELVRNVTVQSGRFLTPLDVERRHKVAILGTAVINNLFPINFDPLGATIWVNGEMYKVIGIIEEKAQGQNYSVDDKIIIPVSVAQRSQNSAIIRNFYVRAKSPETVDMAKFKVEGLLFEVFKNEDMYSVVSQAEMLSQVGNITGTITIFLSFIAGISLVVGGIGIMNIMLVSVTERTREIGIRKAVGAKRKHIMLQFLVESAIISCMGGIVGILLGFLLVSVIPRFSPLLAVITFRSIITSFSVSAFVGLFFGIYPANKASKLNPIEALRFE